MTVAQRINHVRSVGPRKHGLPLCSKCQSRTLQSKKRRAIGLCLECAGGRSKRTFAECAGAHALRSLLAQRGLTIRQFAAEFGTGENNVGKWARGCWRPQIHYRKLLEERYQIPVSAWPCQKPSKRKPAKSVESKQRLIEVKF